MNNKSFFVKCNMVRYSEIEFNKFGVNIKLPFYFHIKDISNTFFDEETENILEFYGSDLNQQNDNIIFNEDFLEIIKHVDLRNLTIDELLEEYKEDMSNTPYGYVFKNHTSLYSFLIKEFNFNEVDFKIMKDFVEEESIKLFNSFQDMLVKELRIGKNKEDVSEAFMLLRGAFESSYAGSIFPENIGLCYSQYSYREILVQRLYFARKCEIEKAMMEEHENKFSKK